MLWRFAALMIRNKLHGACDFYLAKLETRSIKQDKESVTEFDGIHDALFWGPGATETIAAESRKDRKERPYYLRRTKRNHQTFPFESLCENYSVASSSLSVVQTAATPPDSYSSPKCGLVKPQDSFEVLSSLSSPAFSTFLAASAAASRFFLTSTLFFKACSPKYESWLMVSSFRRPALTSLLASRSFWSIFCQSFDT